MKEKRNIKRESGKNEGINPEEEEEKSSLRTSVASRKCKTRPLGFGHDRSCARTFCFGERFYFTRA